MIQSLLRNLKAAIRARDFDQADRLITELMPDEAYNHHEVLGSEELANQIADMVVERVLKTKTELTPPRSTATVKSYYTDAELCERFGVSTRTTKRWRDAGLIKFIRPPGSTMIRYRAKAIDEFEIRNQKLRRRK